MNRSVRSILAGLLLLLCTGWLLAQPSADRDRPALHVPVRAATRQELDHRDAMKLYALGLLQERRNQLVEAVRSFEAARRLDPDAASVHKALIPLYLALERVEDALGSCRRALELKPDDFETSYLYARQLRGLDRRKEALVVLRRTVKCAGIKERPDLLAQVWFDVGVLSEQGSDWKGAEAAFREVAAILEKPAALLEQGVLTREEITTQAAETYERLGRICLRAGAINRAAAAFREAQKKDPIRAARLAYNLAQVYEGQGKHREALARLEEYLRTQPQGTEGYELKIKLQRKLRRDADVLPELATASGRDPANTGLKLLLAREYRAAGYAVKAEGIYKDLMGKTVNPEVYRGLFALYKDQEARGGEKALRLLDDAVKAGMGSDKKPGSPGEAASARAMLVVLRADAELVKLMLPAARARLLSRVPLAYGTRVLLATLAARTRQLDAAEVMYRSCLERRGGLGDMEADVYGGLLRVLKLRNKNAAIVALCKQGLARAEVTNRVLFHLELARAQLLLGNNKEALAAADAAVNDAGVGQRLFSRLTRVDILSQSRAHDKAIAECRALLKEYNHGGELREVRIGLSNALAAAEKYEESEGQLLLVLKDDPNDAMVNNNLGYAWADRNKHLAEAEQMIRKAIDLDRKARSSATAVNADSDRDSGVYLDSLGWVLFRRGKLEEAQAELEKAVALPDGADDPVVWDHLGDVYYRRGAKAKALGAWKKAVGLYDAGARRKADERYKEIQEKVRLLKP
jgi:tetratricopeptide (TPR) repeat protein